MDDLLMGTVYETDRAVVFYGMAEDALPRLKPKSVDLIVTDPPYGQSYQGGSRMHFPVMQGDSGDYDVAPVLAQALSALRRHRHLYVFGPHSLDSLPLGPTAQLVWDKCGMNVGGIAGLSSPWAGSWEPITFATYWPSKANREQGRGRLAARLRQGSVLRFQRKNSRQVNRHPTEKPVALMRCLIEASSLPSEAVLDPFAGSGSTLVAAILSGRRGIGIECEKRYVDVMVERVRAAEKVADSMEAL